MTEKVLIGKITSSHGLKGQVKIMSYCYNPEDIGNYNPIFDEEGNEFNIKITSKPQGKNQDIFIINISGINDINETEKLRNKELFVDKDKLKDEDEDEFYYVDLIGLNVVNDENEIIGEVIDVVNYGAGDIVEIKFNDKAKQKENIQMFSFRDEIFPEINLKDNFLKIIFPETVEIKL